MSSVKTLLCGLAMGWLGCNTAPPPPSKAALAVPKTLLQSKGLGTKQVRIFLRAFKAEERLEVWAQQPDQTYILLESYPFCVNSGTLGPKRREGDLQIPEGVYFIDRFNPNSQFHLSLGLNYPNAADRYHGDSEAPGSDIFIHGACVSVGCIAITDRLIVPLYHLAELARNSGQTQVPVHIFPTKDWAHLPKQSPHHAFWTNLKLIYDQFESTHRLFQVQIDAQGQYQLP